MGCQECRDSGWLLEKVDGIESVRPCPGCRRDNTVGRLLKQTGIPPRYFDKSLDSYHPLDKSSQQNAARKAVDYIESFPDVSRGLLFAGPCGVGKTHLSVAILRALVEEKMVSGRFVDETEMLRRLQHSYGPESRDTERQLLRPLMEADLLVWDDLGSGRGTEWARETIGMVLNYRYTYSRQTILSTNRSIDAGAGTRQHLLEERIGRRLFSRIMEMCEVVALKGPDFRTEVHKAGQDFRAEATSASRDDTLACPRCGSAELQQLDEAVKDEGREMFCRCTSCGEHFTSRVIPGAAVEYLLG